MKGQRKGNSKDFIIKRALLRSTKIDTNGRDIVIAFNEPAFKFSSKDLEEGDLDSKLNARFVSYFLPAVEIARKQKKRPRMFIVSGLNMALKWNAKSEKQKKIMMINNNLKMDFLKNFFEKNFPDDFSVIEYIVAQDPLKISEEKMIALWRILERKYTEDIGELKYALARFKQPKLFANKKLSPKAISFLNSQDEELISAFKYAISHLFATGDINFEGNYVHNKVGYISIGGPAEKIFNKLRKLALDVLNDIAELLFERKVIYMDNLRLVVETENHVPPPYNGYFEYHKTKTELGEVTFENKRGLDFYDEHEKLKPDMEYIYKLIKREEYEEFWNDYKKRYFELKKRYREAYSLDKDF